MHMLVSYAINISGSKPLLLVHHQRNPSLNPLLRRRWRHKFRTLAKNIAVPTNKATANAPQCSDQRPKPERLNFSVVLATGARRSEPGTAIVMLTHSPVVALAINLNHKRKRFHSKSLLGTILRTIELAHMTAGGSDGTSFEILFLEITLAVRTIKIAPDTFTTWDRGPLRVHAKLEEHQRSGERHMMRCRQSASGELDNSLRSLPQ